MAIDRGGSVFNAFVGLVEDQFRKNCNDELEFYAGAKSLSENAHMRRVVWVNTGGAMDPVDATDHHQTSEIEARRIYDDMATVEAHMSGENDVEAKCIQASILAAARDVLAHSSQPGAYEVITETAASHSYGGLAAIVQTFIWRLPVFDASVPLATITGVENEGELDAP